MIQILLPILDLLLTYFNFLKNILYFIPRSFA